MKNSKYISIKEVFSELLTHPLLKDLTLDRVITYAIEFCRKWGASVLFEEKDVILDVKNYKAELPCDFYSLIAVRDTVTKINYRESANIWHKVDGEYNIKVVRPLDENVERIEPSASFTGSYENPNVDTIVKRSAGNNGFLPDNESYQDLTYKLNGNVLFLSITNNQIEVLYQAIKSDDEGFPMILDDAQYIQALQDYIKLKCFTVMFDCGKIQAGILQNTQQQYAFSARILQSHLNSITPDMAVTIGNIMNSMLTYRGHHNGLRNAGTPIKFKIH